MIFAWPELHAMHTRRTSLARDALVRKLRDYQDWTGVRVIVVFDGTGSAVDVDAAPGEIQIFYSRAGQTADAIVERLASKYGSQFSLLVATSDYHEQETVGGLWRRVHLRGRSARTFGRGARALRRNKLTAGNSEMHGRAARAGLRILEVLVNHRCRTGGESKVSGTLRGTFVAGSRSWRRYCAWPLGCSRVPVGRPLCNPSVRASARNRGTAHRAAATGWRKQQFVRQRPPAP